MSKAAYKKRLDQLAPQRTDKPTEYSGQNTIDLFTEFATDGIISAETLAAIHAKKNENGFNIFECCTNRELHALSYLTGTPKDRQETVKQANDPLWRNLRNLDIEDLERLDKLIDKYK